MTEQELWNAYIERYPEERDTPYEAWCYGSDDPDGLLALTVAGTKTATASAYPFYVFEKCPLPTEGTTSVILNTREEAVCIIRDVQVTVAPFLEVTAEHAYKEGEGDRSLAFWRRVHQEVFTAELREIGETFSPDMLVVCEEFRVAFRAEEVH